MKKIKMNLVAAILISFAFASCEKEVSNASPGKAGQVAMNVKGSGATQLSGISYFDATGACSDAMGAGATYALTLTGDLAGCWYVFVDEFDCSPSGTYREQGRELFVGTYNGEAGSFWTGYRFEAKYEGCAPDGSYLGAEIFGRCQHPIMDGSGEGVFEGVSGRFDFKDDIEAGNFPYRGHIRY
ncbi:MAG: hypothetical protein V4717_00380 [Bacteroidota bacterium]